MASRPLLFLYCALAAPPLWAQREAPLAQAAVALPEAPPKPPLVINIPGVPGDQSGVALQPPAAPPAEQAPAAPAAEVAAPAPWAPPTSPAPAAVPGAPSADSAVVAAAPSAPPTVPAAAVPAEPPPAPAPPPQAVPIVVAAVPAAAPPPAVVAAAAAAVPQPAQIPEDPPGIVPPGPPAREAGVIDTAEKLARAQMASVGFVEMGDRFIRDYLASGAKEGPIFKDFKRRYDEELKILQEYSRLMQKWVSQRVPSVPAKKAPRAVQ